MEEGINLLLKERNYAFAGRKVDIIFADTAGQPAARENEDAGAHRARESPRDHRALATFEALAIDDYIMQSKVPLITPTSAAQMDLAQQKKSDYVIHVYGTAAQPMHVLGQYAAKTLGLKRIAMIADDFTYGHEGAAGFHRVFEDNGGRVVQKLWPPLTSRVRLLRRADQEQRGRRLRRLRREQPAALPARLQGVRPEEPRVRQPDSGRRRDPQEHGRRSARRVLGELVYGGPRHARQQTFRAGDPRRVQGDAGFYTAGPTPRGCGSRKR